MATNIHTQFSLSKLGEFLFARQTPLVEAETHKSLVEPFRAWRERRAAEKELAQMSDRNLADIGLTRQGIKAAVRARRAK
jgi:uncharacterized protein YjiS (DUF1127 family)